MHLHIIAVGRAKNRSEQVLIEQYAKQLPWKLTIKEVEEKKPLHAEQLKVREGELLLAAAPPNSFKIALDGKGKMLTSLELANKIGQWRDQGEANLAFFIGGANGHGENLLSACQFRLSLGSLTWPHMLVRAMLAEQLYRAYSILNNHPYHRE